MTPIAHFSYDGETTATGSHLAEYSNLTSRYLTAYVARSSRKQGSWWNQSG